MKKYYASLLNELRKFISLQNEIQEKRDQIKEQLRKEIIGHETYRLKMKELDEQIISLRYSFPNTINAIYNSALSYIDEHYGIHGEDLTADAQLFTTANIEFARSELNQYAEKYKSNPTMLRVIYDYCKRHNIETTSDVMINGIMSADGIKQKWKDMCNSVAAAAVNVDDKLYSSLLEHQLEKDVEHASENM